MNEAANENWSSRQLARQISVLYYERLLFSAAPEAVKNEAIELLGYAVTETDECRSENIKEER